MATEYPNLNIQIGRTKDMKKRLEKEAVKCGVSRIEKALSGKTPEEQFAFLHWLMFDYGTDTSNSDIARIEWLRQ